MQAHVNTFLPNLLCAYFQELHNMIECQGSSSSEHNSIFFGILKESVTEVKSRYDPGMLRQEASHSHFHQVKTIFFKYSRAVRSHQLDSAEQIQLEE